MCDILTNNIIKNIHTIYDNKNKMNDIFLLIKYHNIPYTKLNNGIDINLFNVKYELLYIINNILLCKDYKYYYY